MVGDGSCTPQYSKDFTSIVTEVEAPALIIEWGSISRDGHSHSCTNTVTRHFEWSVVNAKILGQRSP